MIPSDDDVLGHDDAEDRRRTGARDPRYQSWILTILTGSPTTLLHLIQEAMHQKIIETKHFYQYTLFSDSEEEIYIVNFLLIIDQPVGCFIVILL